MNKKRIAGACAAAIAAMAFIGCAKTKSGGSVKVGILHSITGTMAMSERAVRDAEMLAIKEINEAGGVLGKKIKVVEEDGQSSPSVFAEKARKLLQKDEVAAVFGCWTSAARKAVKPVFEELYGLLWYPVQYEGLEASPNIMYMGATPNQQVIPAIDYCAKRFGKRMALIGSDYVFPKAVNKIIKAQLDSLGGSCVMEKYVPLGQTDFSGVVEEIRSLSPDVIINTMNGDSNIHFFRRISGGNTTPLAIPTMNFSVAESEIAAIGTENTRGAFVSWGYFDGEDDGKSFAEKYKKAYGEERVTSDPIASGYIAVHLWAKACEKAGTFDVEAVRIAAKGLSAETPCGNVTIDGSNQHLYRNSKIGVVNGDGHMEEVWSSKSPIKPDPYLSTYGWARGMYCGI